MLEACREKIGCMTEMERVVLVNRIAWVEARRDERRKRDMADGHELYTWSPNEDGKV